MIIKQKTINQISELSSLDQFHKIELENHHTTASKGMMAETARFLRDNHQITSEAMIRPRTDNYLFSDLEIKVMEADVFEAQALGFDSVALGTLTEQKQLDFDAMEQLIAAAGGMQVTLNHAFDELDHDAQIEAIKFANDHKIDHIMLKAEDSSSFATKINKLIEANQGSVQFVLTGNDERKLTDLCHKFNQHLLLVED